MGGILSCKLILTGGNSTGGEGKTKSGGVKFAVLFTVVKSGFCQHFGASQQQDYYLPVEVHLHRRKQKKLTVRVYRSRIVQNLWTKTFDDTFVRK